MMVLVRICVPLLMRQCGPNISQHRLHGSLSNDKVHGETANAKRQFWSHAAALKAQIPSIAAIAVVQ